MKNAIICSLPFFHQPIGSFSNSQEIINEGIRHPLQGLAFTRVVHLQLKTRAMSIAKRRPPSAQLVIKPESERK